MRIKESKKIILPDPIYPDKDKNPDPKKRIREAKSLPDMMKDASKIKQELSVLQKQYSLNKTESNKSKVEAKKGQLERVANAIRDARANQSESVNELKEFPSKEKLVAYMLKGGHNKKSAERVVDANYEYVKKYYKDEGLPKLSDILWTVESVNERYTGNPGDKLVHKHNPKIEIELIEPTNRGWKVYQIEKGKKKITYFDKQDITGRNALFETLNLKPYDRYNINGKIYTYHGKNQIGSHIFRKGDNSWVMDDSKLKSQDIKSLKEFKKSHPFSLKEFVIKESDYNFGKVEYTSKKMTPVEIQDIAFAYLQARIGKLVGKNIDNRIRVSRDLGRLVGRKLTNPDEKSKEPAWLLYLHKNKLVTMEEYKELYTGLIAKLKKVLEYVKNADPATRMDPDARAAAKADIKKYTMGENVLSDLYNHFFGLKKGDIVVRPKYAADSDGMYLLLNDVDKKSETVDVMFVGTISKNSEGNPYASFITNTKDIKSVKIKNNSDSYTSYRKPNNNEKKLINTALTEEINQRYLEIIQQKTGIKIKKQ